MYKIVDARISLPFELRPSDDEADLSAYYSQYNAVLDLEEKRKQTFEDLKQQMNASGISHGIIHAEYEYGDPVDELNLAVANIIRQEPNFFTGFGTISMNNLQPMKAIKQLENVKKLGLIGINIQPAFFNIPMDHEKLYPVYAKASELGIVVAIHTGINYSRPNPMINEHPLKLDKIASDFPELTLIACHASWPWIPEIVAVARRHPNVMLEFGGLAPKYIGVPGSGWEVLYQFMGLLSDQLLFATDWPVFPIERAVREWKNLGLKQNVLEKLFSGNVERIINKAKEAVING